MAKNYIPADFRGNADQDFIDRNHLSYKGSSGGKDVYVSPDGDKYYFPPDNGGDDNEDSGSSWLDVLGDYVTDGSNSNSNNGNSVLNGGGYKGYGARGNNWGPSPGANNNYGKGDYADPNNDYSGGYTDPNRDYAGGYTNPDQSWGYADSGSKYCAGSYANSGQVYGVGNYAGSNTGSSVVNSPVVNDSYDAKGRRNSVTDNNSLLDRKPLPKKKSKRDINIENYTAKRSQPLLNVTDDIVVNNVDVLDPSSKYRYFVNPDDQVVNGQPYVSNNDFVSRLSNFFNPDTDQLNYNRLSDSTKKSILNTEDLTIYLYRDSSTIGGGNLSQGDLQKIKNELMKIYSSNGISLNVILINTVYEGDALKQLWSTGKLPLNQAVIDFTSYGSAQSGALGQTRAWFYHPGSGYSSVDIKEVNWNYQYLPQQQVNTKYKELAFLAAHELLHYLLMASFFSFGYGENDEIDILGEDKDEPFKGHINIPRSLNYYIYHPGDRIEKDWEKILPEDKAVINMFTSDLKQHNLNHNTIKSDFVKNILNIRKANRRLK
ncbi:MAG: hypothetical protein BGO69_01740 [Bacteroidetes bacterium 46-16]|nr:MAG: hypothetical protein BGO69_01740 [Bacteroidetes bacterium 46-16]